MIERFETMEAPCAQACRFHQKDGGAGGLACRPDRERVENLGQRPRAIERAQSIDQPPRRRIVSRRPLLGRLARLLAAGRETLAVPFAKPQLVSLAPALVPSALLGGMQGLG